MMDAVKLLEVFDRLLKLPEQYEQVMNWDSLSAVMQARVELLESSAITNFVKMVNELEQECINKAREENQKRKISPLDQRQELTEGERIFIKQAMKRLARVIPITGELILYTRNRPSGLWCLYNRQQKTAYTIEEGDRLILHDEYGEVCFDQIIVRDEQSGWHPFNENFPYGKGRQICRGSYVDWIPKGLSSAEWAKIVKEITGCKALLYGLPKENNEHPEVQEGE